MASEQAISHSLPLPSAARRGALERARLLLLRHGPLVAVLALSATLNSYALSQNGYANAFYSAGVKSGLHSLHDLLFNSFDPGGLVTIDKPPLALWVQVASAKLFGFAPLSLLLPEAIAGVLAVGALYWAMVRPFGRTAALIGAFALAVFPAFVAVSRDNGPDPVLILLMVLACVAALRAIDSGRLRTLVLSGVLVALAFNTKTLAAFVIVPPIACAYLVCAPGALRRRVARLAAAGVALAAVSLMWLALVDLTPASQRPYVGGSTNNSELGLTFSYNGFGRIDGQEGAHGEIPDRPGAAVLTAPPPSAGNGNPATSGASATVPTLSHGLTTGVGSWAGVTGPLRLLNSELGRQGGWLFPLALVSLIALVLASVLPGSGPGSVRERRSPRLAALLVLGGWFLLEAIVLSFAGGIVHPYYAAALAPGAAAMMGAGAALFIALARARSRLLLLFPLAIAVTVAAPVVLLERDHYLKWLPPLLVAGAVGAIVLALLALGRRGSGPRVSPRLSTSAIVLLSGLLLIAPTAYATTTWLAPGNGTFPAAGPHAAAGPGGFGLEGADPPVFRSLVAYAATHQAGTRFSVLTVSSVTAAPLILMGSNAAALGGYGGTDPALDGSQLARLVARGEARYVLLGGGYSERGGNKSSVAVLSACRQLPTATWGGPPLEPYSFVLFDCKGREAALREGAQAAPGS
jgi:4-amino-4-deoxy-L-arabinose transferase-like glycosyltransferase